MKTKIEIKSGLDDRILFEYEKENNTIKDTLHEAVRQGADLKGADLKGADLEGADLKGADLEGADLKKANLKDADLEGAHLWGANLWGANLKNANLKNADLNNANFYSANLHKAILEGAHLWGVSFYETSLKKANLKNADLRYTIFPATDLEGADLCGADLYRADFRGANLYRVNLKRAILCGADFYGAKEIPYIPLACPSEGSFIGWKKVKLSKEYGHEPFLIKLEIPEDALRSSATTSKCRCSKAKVLEITNIRTGKSIERITNINEKPCGYKVGEMVFPDSFDENRFRECSHGIHFFVKKQDAIDYMQ